MGRTSGARLVTAMQKQK